MHLPNRVATYEPRNSGPSLSPLKTAPQGGSAGGRAGGRRGPGRRGRGGFSPGAGGDAGRQVLQFTFLSRAPASLEEHTPVASPLARYRDRRGEPWGQGGGGSVSIVGTVHFPASVTTLGRRVVVSRENSPESDGELESKRQDFAKEFRSRNARSRR